MPGNAESFPLERDPLWYKDAIIYELHVRAFHDSDGDGIGDFRGLTQKLDYLQDLGVTALWLLPFCPSPLRDDGYDIADYTSIHPTYGTLRDFRTFLREAHRRGLRVITELVVNHTSDQHPWFQRARRAKPGSALRNFYVWNEAPDRYQETRIIFKDFEPSNWSWDPVAKAYFWHRFYAHQPDLNYDHPPVRRAINKVLDFWLGMGVDGLRLDAVPYLFEREGTTCENLAETHQYLKELRRHVDEKFANRMFLAEANQWPEDAAAYFGDGDECHMNFHFPLMPRLFMAVRMEDRYPIIDILQQTPVIPESCQWALFLRNHDELTLEMVTDEERDYMYRAYANEVQMRINLGIRRRLAPLLGNDRRKIELLNGLLFSMPGTPVLYYGDEIGMGDNFYLGDRNGVRTPMQWNADRNAGFSQANPQKLYLPVTIDPEYHFEAINVENQQNNPHSLLWWMKHLISMRKRYKVFGRGTLEILQPENRKVLAFIRRYQDECVLVVANLSRFAQYVELDLSPYQGITPLELGGRLRFPPITERSYVLTLTGHTLLWFSLEPQRQEIALTPEAELPTLSVRGTWTAVFSSRNRTRLEELLPDYLRPRRWFAGKARTIEAVNLLETVPVPRDMPTAYLTLFQVMYTDGEPEIYLLPLAFGAQDTAAPRDSQLARLQVQNGPAVADGVLYDAMSDKHFASALFALITRHRRTPGEAGEVSGMTARAFRPLLHTADGLEPTIVRAEQSNTSVVYGDLFILKLFRRLDEGVNPELEIGRYLTEVKNFSNIAPVAGALEYRRHNGGSMTLAVLESYLPNQGDAWQYTLDTLHQYFAEVLAHPDTVAAVPLPGSSVLDLLGEEPPPLAEATIGYYLDSARLLGQRTGELHVALAQATDDAAFTPEHFTDFYRRGLYQGMISEVNHTLQLLRQRLPYLPEAFRTDAQQVLDMQAMIRRRFQALRDRRISTMRIRCHGDYHLGQVLYTGKDFVIIDFEGEPARPLSLRRMKRCPLYDVAGMLRSFHYAAYAALLGQSARVRPEDLPALDPWARFWYTWVSVTFLRTYLEVIAPATLLPSTPEQLRILLEAFLLEKAIYELAYELNSRPDWVKVPLQGILQLVEVSG
jgi:maltose alpha-D-glucosyltransferase/alpha-amylase